MLRAAASLLALAVSAHAWDLAGHMIVGEIAWQASTPAVRAKVEELVRGLDTTFSGGQAYNFVTANAWLDDMRGQGRAYQWGKWHYMDNEKTDDGAAFTVPEPPHVVWAIDESLKTLRDAQAPAAKRSEALGILMHCVGDVHQPLHATTWNDRGGNGYLVGGVSFSDLYKGGRGNLHAFWDEAYRVEARDGKIVERFVSPPITSRPEPGKEGDVASAAKQIMTDYPAEALNAEAAVLDPVAWAKESHVIGCTKAFPPGPHPGNHEVRTLEPAFAAPSQKIAARRIALAGYRLARVLDSVFGAH